MINTQKGESSWDSISNKLISVSKRKAKVAGVLIGGFSGGVAQTMIRNRIIEQEIKKEAIKSPSGKKINLPGGIKITVPQKIIDTIPMNGRRY